MREKINFCVTLLGYNVLHYFPGSDDYLLTRLGLDALPGSGRADYAAVLSIGRERFGLAGLGLANLMLALPALPLLLAVDLISPGFQPRCGALLLQLGGFALCLRKFEVFHGSAPVSLLKFGYLVLTMICSFWWSVAYIFMAAFENLVCLITQL